MKDTGDVSVESEDPHEWCTEKVDTFLGSLGTAECFQSPGDQLLYLGVDDSVFFGLSVNELQGVCGHTRGYDLMCEFTHNNTDTCEHGDTDRTQLNTSMTHETPCNLVPVLLFLQGVLITTGTQHSKNGGRIPR